MKELKAKKSRKLCMDKYLKIYSDTANIAYCKQIIFQYSIFMLYYIEWLPEDFIFNKFDKLYTVLKVISFVH